jgi:PhnB protein
MTKLNPYLSFNGTCEEAFNFYRSVFGGDFLFVGRFKDMPENTNYPVLESEKEKIMHITLPISSETVLYGCDATIPLEGSTGSGSNVSLSVETDSIDEATRIFTGLSAGGHVTMPLEKTFWDAYFGMFTDKYGINWMVNYDLSKSKS